MKSFISFLFEIFDTPYNYRKVKETDSELRYAFKGTNDKFFVHFSKKAMMEKGLWGVSFSDELGETRITSKGDEYKVFSTVVKIIGDVITERQYEISKMLFEARKSERDAPTNRIRLYKSIIDRMLPPGWSYSMTSDHTGDTFFLLKNKKYTEK